MSKLKGVTRITAALLAFLGLEMSVALGLGSGLASAAEGDWPQWLGPDRSGAIPAPVKWSPSWSGRPRIAWTAQVGVGYSSVAVAAGKAYTMGAAQGEETLYAFDALSGKRLWAQTYPAKLVDKLHQGGPSSTPTVDGERVLSLSKDGKLFAWDASSGQRLWGADLHQDLGLKLPEWGFTSSPLVLGDRVIVDVGPTLAVDRATGRIAWKSKLHKPAYSSPVAFQHQGKTRLASLNSDGLVVLDAQDGRELAFAEWRTAYDTNAATPLVVGDRIYISTGYERGHALFRFTGSGLEKVWENKALANHMNNSVLVDGHLYGFDGNGHSGGPKSRTFLVCVELDTGRELWRHQGLGCGSLIAVGGTLVILSDWGELVTARATPEGYKPLSQAKVTGPERFTSRNPCWTSPAAAQGLVYVRDTQGKLVCVDLRAGDAAR